MVGTRSKQTTFDRQAGTILKEARKKRKMTLDEVASVLRIPPIHLKSLEEGDLSVFSAEVYAMGAYKKYAKYLGVDTKESFNSFLRSLSGARERVPLRLPVPSSWLQRTLTPTGFFIVGVTLIIAAVAGYILIQVETFVRVPDLAIIEPSTSILTSTTVKVKGTTEANAEITVNGEAVLLNEANEFEYELPLRSGINVLQVEATGTSGRTIVLTKHLLVPRHES